MFESITLAELLLDGLATISQPEADFPLGGLECVFDRSLFCYEIYFCAVMHTVINH